ncbi:MAG: hypothetical protein IPP87_05465 [Ideonella sp.]|nr:hypothetical protein [Ideonella sp.]
MDGSVAILCRQAFNDGRSGLTAALAGCCVAPRRATSTGGGGGGGGGGR